jgi:hypothetical protein
MLDRRLSSHMPFKLSFLQGPASLLGTDDIHTAASKPPLLQSPSVMLVVSGDASTSRLTFFKISVSFIGFHKRLLCVRARCCARHYCARCWACHRHAPPLLCARHYSLIIVFWWKDLLRNARSSPTFATEDILFGPMSALLQG